MVILLAFVYEQEEERERRMDYVPDESAVNTETIEVSGDWRICSSCSSFCVFFRLRE